MPIERISGLNNAVLPLDPTTLFAVVPPDQINIATNKTPLSSLITSVLAHMGFVTIGSGAQYATINAAYVAGKYKMWAIGNVTETTTTTYANPLHIIVNDGVTIAANADVKLIAGNATSSIAWEFFGKPTISFSLTSSGAFMDASAATGVAPAIITKGLVNIINTSDVAIAAEPMTAPSALLDSIIYTTDGGIDSYFDFGVAAINYFELSPTTALEDSMGVKITGYGKINQFYLTANCSDDSILYDINDSTVGYTVSSNASGVPTCYLRNSKCQSATGIQQAIHFNMSALVDGEQSSLSDGLNVVVILSGSIGSNIDNCQLAALNVAGITGGVNNISNSRLAGPITIANSDTMCNFSQTQFSQGCTVSNGSHTFDICNFGQNGGSTYTLTLEAGAVNCSVIAPISEVAIVNNGTGNYIVGERIF